MHLYKIIYETSNIILQKHHINLKHEYKIDQYKKIVPDIISTLKFYLLLTLFVIISTYSTRSSTYRSLTALVILINVGTWFFILIFLNFFL